MNKESVILLSADEKIIMTCAQVGSETGVQILTRTEFSWFMFELKKSEYYAAIIECSGDDKEFLRRIKLINRLKPQLPVIVIANEKDRNIGAKILGAQVFNLLFEPIDKTLLCEIISTAIKRYLTNKTFKTIINNNYKKVEVTNHEE